MYSEDTDERWLHERVHVDDPLASALRFRDGLRLDLVMHMSKQLGVPGATFCVDTQWLLVELFEVTERLVEDGAATPRNAENVVRLAITRSGGVDVDRVIDDFGWSDTGFTTTPRSREDDVQQLLIARLGQRLARFYGKVEKAQRRAA